MNNNPKDERKEHEKSRNKMNRNNPKTTKQQLNK